MAHSEPHSRAGDTITIRQGEFAGQEYRIEDWWDRVSGESWMRQRGNPGCLDYAVRSGIEGCPSDDEVLYGKIGSMGKLIHESQL